MKKSKSIILREIYIELRNSLPSETPSREIISLAHGLLNIYIKSLDLEEEFGDEPVFEDNFEDLAPIEWPIDLLMQNEDWDINRFEDGGDNFLRLIEEKDPESLMKYKKFFLD